MFLLSSFCFFVLCIPFLTYYTRLRPHAMSRAPSARGRSYFSVATIWRHVKLLCDHICCYICIPDMSDISRYGRWFESHINTWIIGRTSIDSSLFYSLISTSWEIKLYNNHILFDVIIYILSTSSYKKNTLFIWFLVFFYVIFLFRF